MDGNELIVGAPIQGSAYVFAFASSVIEVPTVTPSGLALLGAMLAVAGVLLLRRRAARRRLRGAS